VIQTIKDYAFANNPYPVILSLENHCKNQQNERIADILKGILGESLYMLPENYMDWEKFPSPEELKFKVLVKDKCRLTGFMKTKSQIGEKAEHLNIENLSFMEFDDDESYVMNKEWNLNNVRAHSSILQKRLFSSSIVSLSEQKGSNDQLFGPYFNIQSNSMNPKTCKKLPSATIRDRPLLESSQDSPDYTNEQPLKKENITPALRKLLSLFSIKISLSVPRTIWNVSSIKEAAFEKLAKNSEDQFQDFLRVYFLRVYPSPARVNSSNFDPIECFNFGVQMTALNFQTNDVSMLLYLGKFQENGGINCGYVLKPEFLRRDKPKYLKNFTKISKILYLEVISGQQLRPENEESVRDVVDPYIEVSLRGIAMDEKENPKTFKSIAVQNNGFNPKFELKCQFKISCPELAFVVFKVFDEEVAVKDVRIGWNAVPFSCLRPGFRILPLLNSNFDEIEFAELLCYVEMKEVVEESGWI
jgi:hypothetical protein